MDDAERWIRAHAEVTGPIETTHEQAWSTVRRVPTADGTWWWKAPDGLAEAPLTAFLAELRPDAVTDVVAIEPDHGWLLLRDAGTRLRELLDGDPDLGRWERALAVVADLQLAATPHAGELVAMGVPDHRVEVLPDLIEDLLGRDEFLLLDEEEGLTRTQREALVAELPAVRAMCEELAAAGIGPSVQHDDLNDGNVYVDGDRYRIVDWGDACVSHPFFTLAVTLEGVIAWGVEDVEDSEDLRPHLAAYLGPYAAHYGTTVAHLREAAAMAMRLGWVCRAVNGALPQDPGQTHTRLRMFLDGKP